MLTRLPRLLVLLLLFACCARHAAEPPTATDDPSAPAPTVAPKPGAPELMAIDLFGTRQITLDELLARFGDRLRAFSAARMNNVCCFDTPGFFDALQALGDFAYVQPALVGYYQPDGMKYYLTVDFVDPADAARRMSFSPAPTGTHPDPDGLLTDWEAYESKVFELTASGEMSPKRFDCPAFHCFGDPGHPAVKQLVATFPARVKDHVPELATILSDDLDDRDRAAAAFLLAYSGDGPGLVELLIPAIHDPSELVRNNAMRVLADIASHHPEVEVPVEPILEALDFPATTDRNKASAILAGLLQRTGTERLHRIVATRAGAILVAMLRLQQPNNHDFAYTILKAISGQDLGERNYAAWESWLAELDRGEPAAGN